MSYKYNISGVTLDDKVFGNLANVSIANAFRNMGKHFEGVAIGAISESVTLNSGPTKGTGTITIASGNMSNGDTVTINSIVLTGETGTPSGTAQFKVGSSAIKTGMALAACINANPSLSPLVKAVYTNGAASAGVVTLTAVGNGTAGNYTWSQSGSNVTLSPASAMGGGASGPVAAAGTVTFASTGPTNGQTMTILNATFTAETSGAVAASGQFNINASATVVAVNLAAAINATPATNKSVVATSALGVVTVTSLVPGTIGNGLQMVNGNLSNTTVVGFTGGTDALVQTFHKGI